MTRRWEFDALRGLMLLLMTFTHLPTRLSSPLGQPLGFVSAAEGFVLLSAFMAGMVYTRLARKRGIDAMQHAFWRRALKVYVCHAATLVFLFTAIAAVGLRIDQPAVKDLMSFYLAHPANALVTGLLLIYTPPLLDILPIYILFMLASPWVLAFALRHGWRPVFVVSVLLWVLAQFGLGWWFYRGTVALTGLTVPFHETGSFANFAWQLLWVVGLWLGARQGAEQVQPLRFSPGVVVFAIVVALTGLVWRHVEGQAAFGANEHLNLLFDKWLLGPLRLLNLFALVVLAMRYGDWLKAHVPRLRWLEKLGAASLSVFCAHLVVVLLALAFLGSNPLRHAGWVDAALVGACLAILYAVALAALRLDHPQGLREAPGSEPIGGPGWTPVAAPVRPAAPEDARG